MKLLNPGASTSKNGCNEHTGGENISGKCKHFISTLDIVFREIWDIYPIRCKSQIESYSLELHALYIGGNLHLYSKER